MSPKKNSNFSLQRFLSVLRFLAGLIVTWVAVYEFTHPNPAWSVGFALLFLGGFLLVGAFPAKNPLPTEKADSLQSSTKEAAGFGTAIFQALASYGSMGLGRLLEAVLRNFIKNPKKRKALSSNLLQQAPAYAPFGIIVLLAAGQTAFWGGKLSSGWILDLLALAVTVGLIWGRGASKAKPLFPHMDEEKWLWAVLALSALLRLAFVGTNVTGLQGDEANNLTDTIGISQGIFTKGPFVTGWGGTPVLPDFIVGSFFKVLGEKLWVARLVSSLASLGTLLFFYRWCRFWLSPAASLASTFFLSVSWWFFFFSLSPFHNSLLFLFQVAAFYFMEKGLRGGRRMDFAWAGLFCALCVMNYVAGRSVPVALFVTVLAALALRGWVLVKAAWKPLALSVAVFFWALAAFLVYAVQNPGEFWGRVDPHWISQEYQHSGSYFFLVKSYFFTLTALLAPDPSSDLRFTVVGLPFVDPFASAFLFLGLGFCLFRLRKPSTWVVLPGFFLGLTANALARLGWPTDLAYIHAIRLSVIIPFAFLACGWGVEVFLHLWRDWSPKKSALLAGLVLGGALLGSSAMNEPLFINRFGQGEGAWGDHGFSQIDLAGIILKNADTHHFLVDSAVLSNAVVFLVHEKADPKWLFLDKDIPIPYRVHKNVLLVFPPWRATQDQILKIHQIYPGAAWTEYKTPWGNVYLDGVDIPLDEILASQKGMTLTEDLP